MINMGWSLRPRLGQLADASGAWPADPPSRSLVDGHESGLSALVPGPAPTAPPPLSIRRRSRNFGVAVCRGVAPAPYIGRAWRHDILSARGACVACDRWASAGLRMARFCAPPLPARPRDNGMSAVNPRLCCSVCRRAGAAASFFRGCQRRSTANDPCRSLHPIGSAPTPSPDAGSMVSLLQPARPAGHGAADAGGAAAVPSLGGPRRRRRPRFLPLRAAEPERWQGPRSRGPAGAPLLSGACYVVGVGAQRGGREPREGGIVAQARAGAPLSRGTRRLGQVHALWA